MINKTQYHSVVIASLLVITLILIFFMIAATRIAFIPLTTIISTPSQTERHMQYASALRDAVDAFETSRNDTSNQIATVAAEITELTKDIIQTQSNEEPGESVRNNTPQVVVTKIATNDGTAESKENNSTVKLKALAEMWETEWVEVHTSFDDLSERFVAIGTAADSYFKQLDSITETIGDSQIKTLEQEKNRQLRDEWNAAFEQAATDLAALGDLINKGDDFGIIIQIVILRATISENIVQVQEISMEAQTLLVQLGQLTVEGHKLIRGQSDL